MLPQMKDWTEKLSTGLDLSVAHYRFVSAFKLRASTDDKYLFQTTACTARGGGGARDVLLDSPVELLRVAHELRRT